MGRCKTCGIEVNKYKQYCNRNCYFKSKILPHISRECLVCKKVISGTINCISGRKYCSKKCAGTVTGKISGKASVLVNKEKCQGLFNSKIQELGNISQKYYRTGFYSSALQSELGTRGAAANKKACTGMWNSGIHQSAFIAFANRSRYKWEGVGFSTFSEMECAKRILIKPILGVNCQFSIGRKSIDFYPQESDKMFNHMFVEYHPTEFNNKMFHANETFAEYYARRRKLLDDNGFKDKHLIVLNRLDDIPKELTDFDVAIKSIVTE